MQKPMAKTFFNQKGQAIGTLDGEIFRKVVDSKKHYMRIFKGYGFEKTVVDELHALGCKEIRIKDEKGDVYRVPFTLLIERGFTKNLETPQVFLPLALFATGPTPESLFT